MNAMIQLNGKLIREEGKTIETLAALPGEANTIS
jgi:hypothetical protein